MRMAAIGGPLALAAARAVRVRKTEELSNIVDHHRALAASQAESAERRCEEQEPGEETKERTEDDSEQNAVKGQSNCSKFLDDFSFGHKNMGRAEGFLNNLFPAGPRSVLPDTQGDGSARTERTRGPVGEPIDLSPTWDETTRHDQAGGPVDEPVNSTHMGGERARHGQTAVEDEQISTFEIESYEADEKVSAEQIGMDHKLVRDTAAKMILYLHELASTGECRKLDQRIAEHCDIERVAPRAWPKSSQRCTRLAS